MKALLRPWHPGTILLLAGAALFTAPSSARACAVCFDLADRAREAYYETTVLLLIVPFTILGGILYWLRKAMRRQAADRIPASSPEQTRHA